jgi:hypothetical protein
MTGGYGYGSMMLPGGFEGTDFDMGDSSTFEGFSTDELAGLDPALNAYLKDMEDLSNRYTNNQISMEEYLVQLEVLSEKYKDVFNY